MNATDSSGVVLCHGSWLLSWQMDVYKTRVLVFDIKVVFVGMFVVCKLSKTQTKFILRWCNNHAFILQITYKVDNAYFIARDVKPVNHVR